jgi:hypothetical protein
MTLVVVLLILLLLFGGGYGHSAGWYGEGYGGISLVGVIVVILIVLLLTGRLG